MEREEECKNVSFCCFRQEGGEMPAGAADCRDSESVRISCRNQAGLCDMIRISEMYRDFSGKSILVICQELFKEDFDVFFRKKGNFNRPSVCI